MKQNRRNLSGWLVLDKPAGLTSTQALGRARFALRADKAGHGGTLDPFATGVLPIAFGEATKLLPYVLDGHKSYRFTVRWGSTTDSDDCTGTVTQTSSNLPTHAQIATALPQFTGAIQQVPPGFSALHVNGERAYNLARAGNAPILPPRPVTIFRLEIIDPIGPPDAPLTETTFEADCAKGTYIRALARDLGAVLGCLGHVNALRRLAAGPFRLEQAITLEKLQEFGQNSPVPTMRPEFLLSLAAVLDDIPALAVNEMEARRLRQGRSIPVHPGRAQALPADAPSIATQWGDQLIALGHLESEAFVPTRVFNAQFY